MTEQRTLTYFVGGNITVFLTSCLTGLDSAVLLNWSYKQFCFFDQILTGQTGGQPYNDISPYKVSEYSLKKVTIDNYPTAENTHHRVEDHFMAGLHFRWLGFNSFNTFKEQDIFLFGKNSIK